jgi:hypothetical protein
VATIRSEQALPRTVAPSALVVVDALGMALLAVHVGAAATAVAVAVNNATSKTLASANGSLLAAQRISLTAFSLSYP